MLLCPPLAALSDDCQGGVQAALAEEHRNKTVRNSPFFCLPPPLQRAGARAGERPDSPTGEKHGRKAAG